jgi:membrane protein DedA with SNARE-associated domain
LEPSDCEAAMDGTVEFLLRYGYLLLSVVVLAEQIGLPIPAVPVLLGVGALAGNGKMSLAIALGVAVAASLPPDLIWYELGRRRGSRMLGVLCRLSLEPDSCVRRTENLFIRHGRRTLLIAKFLPGLSTIAPPLAGIVGVAPGQFVLLDGLGALVWAGAWMALGYAFHDALEVVAAQAARLGNWLLVVVGLALTAYIATKFIQRQRFLRSLRMARITPHELKRRLDLGDGDLVIVDTRSRLDADAVPYGIPGALWISAEEIDRRHQELPGGREVVLYCT